MFITLTDQKENKFTVATQHIVGWQHIDEMKTTNVILSIHSVGECVSVKETPTEILQMMKGDK